MAETKIAYTEPREGFIYRPYLSESPNVYQPDDAFIEAVNKGEHVTEVEVFTRYFDQIESQDPGYIAQIREMVRGRAERFPSSGPEMVNRRLQLIIPAYREGENIEQFLESMTQQFKQSDSNDWGITFVIDYAVPYAHEGENAARQEMHHYIAHFVEQHPEYRSRVDWIYYVRAKDMEPAILPVGLARKIGEDVIMYERLLALTKREESSTPKPLYLGLMDTDTNNLSEGLIDATVQEAATDDNQSPRIIRVRGSFDREGIKESPHLLPLQMMWEGITSELGRTTNHNPFNIGRLSAVPARELAITGGGFPRRLGFTDEDIRHGIQIAWLLKNVKTVEPDGHYATSPRREVHTMDGVLQLVHDRGDVFDMETLGVAALIRMYGNWINGTYRSHLGNGNGEVSYRANAFNDIESFSRAVPTELIRVMVNAFYRFTATSVYAVDELSQSPFAQEIHDLRDRFLRGEIAYFDVQLQTIDFMRKIVRGRDESPEGLDRFTQLEATFAKIDTRAREAIIRVLKQNSVGFTVDPSIDPIFGLEELNLLPDSSIYALLGLEGDEAASIGNAIKLRAPFQIVPKQLKYFETAKRQLEG